MVTSFPGSNAAAFLECEEELSMHGDDDGGIDLAPSEESGSVKGGGGTGDSEELAHNETKAVGRVKFFVLWVLVVSAIVVAVSVNRYIRLKEEELFVEEFNDDALKVLGAIGLTFDKTLRAFDSVAVSFVTMAAATNQTWPFVTIPNFAKQMTTVLELSNAIHIDFIPVVHPSLRREWENYSSNNKNWINEAMELQQNFSNYHGPIVFDAEYESRIHDDDGKILNDTSRMHFPIWQNFPVVPNESYTYNVDFATLLDPEERIALIQKHEAIISKPCMIPKEGDTAAMEETADLAEEARHYIGPEEEAEEPMSDVVYPILDKRHRTTPTTSPSNDAEDVLVGLLSTAIYWRSMIRNILPVGSFARVVIHNPCTQPFTYEIIGPNVVFLGVGDQHDAQYDSMVQQSRLIDLETGIAEADELFDHAQLEDNWCITSVSVYPSDQGRAVYTSSNSIVFTIAVVGIFLFTMVVFCIYDMTVERRQRTVMDTATRSTAIVSSLFPSAVRDRLYPVENKTEASARNRRLFNPMAPGTKLQSFLKDGKAAVGSNETSAPESPFQTGAIAELYPESTVLFADISGFTAWSSVRTPTQVFQLLESVYAAFDEIARQLGVFKVETVGDSYVAVVGLPTPRKLHAVIMAIFAHKCRIRMNSLTRELEKMLGPGTADLAMRFGLNSGPTTAGVLRGEKSRFQLFGDTVNTAARMESNGERNRIQVSQKTADLIIASGRGHWLTPRLEEVECKGKGLMKTYWCDPKSGSGSMVSSEAGHAVDKEIDQAITPMEGTGSVEANMQRLIDWNVDLFANLLKATIAQRSARAGKGKVLGFDRSEPTGVPLDEVRDVLNLPAPPGSKSVAVTSIQANDLPQVVLEQLEALIAGIAGLYKVNHPFHNFDHVCHVAMSTKKLLDRMSECEQKVAQVCPFDGHGSKTITSDPLTQFAIVFAALVHDVDHPGVSNAQLVHEQHPTAIKYAGKSVAEQNSIDQAWALITKPEFAELRSCIFMTEQEQNQFRTILVNAVLATDLFDKNLKAMRDARWSKSFAALVLESTKNLVGDDANRRATIIIDLIIQVSDVSHTMQYFTVYKKWNMNLLTEMYDAFASGRTDKNPLDGWYEGELWFFDNYIIPLAQKLRECGVFGVSCDEFLDYAVDNRLEWERKGRAIVQEATEMLQVRPSGGAAAP